MPECRQFYDDEIQGHSLSQGYCKDCFGSTVVSHLSPHPFKDAYFKGGITGFFEIGFVSFLGFLKFNFVFTILQHLQMFTCIMHTLKGLLLTPTKSIFL